MLIQLYLKCNICNRLKTTNITVNVNKSIFFGPTLKNTTVLTYMHIKPFFINKTNFGGYCLPPCGKWVKMLNSEPLECTQLTLTSNFVQIKK